MSGEQLFGVNGDSKPIKVGIGARPFGFRWLLFLFLLLLLLLLWLWLLLWWWWVCLKHPFNGGFHFFRLNQSDSNQYIASFCNWDGGTQGFSKGSPPRIFWTTKCWDLQCKHSSQNLNYPVIRMYFPSRNRELKNHKESSKSQGKSRINHLFNAWMTPPETTQDWWKNCPQLGSEAEIRDFFGEQ